MHDYERYRRQAEGRVVTGDLFERPCIVVPVMEGGETYGSISQQALARGLVIPPLAVGEARESSVGGQVMIVVGYWQAEDRPGSTAQVRARALATAAVRLAGVRGHAEVAFPILSAGGYGRQLLPAMEAGVELALDWLEERELDLPDVVYVTKD